MQTLRDPKEIEKEMDQYKVITLGDIYRALRDHPEWTQELRRVFLTEELLELPRKFNKFLEEDFYPLKAKVDKIEKDVEVLKKDVEVLKKDVEKLKSDVGWLKGGIMELQVRDRVGAFFGKILRKARLIDSSDLADAVYEAQDRGEITEAQADDALRIDAVVKGQMRRDGFEEILIAAEISFVVDREDVERASKRAEILSKVFNKRTIPAVIGKEFTEGALEASKTLSVLLI